MPHEQAHAFQGRSRAVAPRWFHEGHAEWIDCEIAAIAAPETPIETTIKGGGDAIVVITGMD